MGGVGVTSPIARGELKKWNAVALIPKPTLYKVEFNGKVKYKINPIGLQKGTVTLSLQ